MECAILRETEFSKSLSQMTKSGGIAKKAAEAVHSIIGKASTGLGRADEIGNLTHHGESRIPNCIKYDLPGFYRLVTIQQSGMIIFATVGKHDDCDRWLEDNKGLRPVIDKKTKRLGTIREIGIREVMPYPAQPPSGRRLVPRDIVDKIAEAGFPQNAVRAIAELEDTATEDELIAIALDAPQNALTDAIFDVFAELRADREDSARARLAVLRGDAVRAEDSPALLREAISAEINSDQVVKLSDLPGEEFTRLTSSGNLDDWLLFLHPDQRRVADAHFAGPVVLGGVSGSGKTTVILHRAKHLASLLAGARIGIFVLNEALAELLAYLKDRLCPPKLAERIDVISLRSFLVGRCKGSHAVADTLALDAVWQETFEASAEVLEPIIRALKARNIDAARYIRDEFRWLHSGFARHPTEGLLTRDDYLVASKVAREGRAIPFSSDWRERIMRSLQAYERALDTRRLCDPEMLGMLAVEGDTSKRYRSVLVDEYQDLGVLELRALLRSVADAPDSIFLAGDARQQVFPKRLSLAESGLPTPTRRRFQKNYRNTQEILDCAWEMLQSSAAGEEGSSLDEADRLKPELSKRRGEQPAVIRADGLEEEHAFVAACVKEHRKTSDAPVCICVCGIRDDEPEYLEGMAEVYRQLGIETRLLSGDAKPQPGVTFLASLETVKGFEFPMVLITQCGAREIPNPGQPAEEAWRDGRRLYVAMTRARDLLVISYHGEQSSFVGAFGEKANFTSIEDYLGFVPEPSPKIPAPVAMSPPLEPARPGPVQGTPHQPAKQAAALVPIAPIPPPMPPTTAATTFIIEPPAMAGPPSIVRSLEALGLEVIDKRPMGGALWVVGGSNLRDLMRKLNKIGFAFVFKADGGRASGRRPAWWTQKTPDRSPNMRLIG